MHIKISYSKQIFRKRETLTLLPKFERMTHKILVTGFCMQFGDFRRLLSHNMAKVIYPKYYKRSNSNLFVVVRLGRHVFFAIFLQFW